MADGHRQEAVTSARKAVTLQPNSMETNANLGFVLVYSGLVAEGVAAIDKALRLDPAPPPNLQLLAGTTLYGAHVYRRAIPLLERARDALPTAESAMEYLAAAYAKDGQGRAAAEQVRQLLDGFPTSNLHYYAALYDHWREADRLHHLEALESAGIPAWPFGFTGREEDRVDPATLQTLTRGTTWVGKHKNGAPFVQEFDRQGNTAYRSENSFLTGTVETMETMLCQRFEGYVLDRPLCGYVYKAGPTDQEPNGYTFVSPDALKFFSLERQNP
jgi:adenylate cyclase